MKKIFALLALVLGVVSCQTEPEGLDVNVGGEQEVMLTVSLPETTRANSANGFDLNSLKSTDYSLRYILEVYLGENCQRHVLVSDNTSVAFPVRLAPDRNYQLVVWADIVEVNSQTDGQADRYYNTDPEKGGLKAVSIVDSTWNAMDETRDAFTATKPVSAQDIASGAIEMKLKRPFAKLRVVATDYDDVDDLGLTPATATVVYSQDMPRIYNALTGIASDAALKSHNNITYPATPVYVDATGEYTLFADYFFVPASGTAKFQFNVYAEGNNLIKATNFNTDIYVAANKLTTIKGDVLTTGANINIDIEGEGAMDAPSYEYNAIGNATAFYEALINGGEYIVTSDLVIDQAYVPSAQLTATRTTGAPAEGKVTTINLNGMTITVKNQGNDAFVTLDTNDALILAGEGTITGSGELVDGGNVVVTGDANVDVNVIPDVKLGINALKYILANGGEFTLTEDLVANEVLFASATNPVVIDLGRNTFTFTSNRGFRINENANVVIKNGSIVNNADAGRCVETRAGGIKLTLENVTLTATNGYYSQPFTVGGEGENITVNINNSTINAGNNGYGITTFNPVALNINNSTVSGYAAVYVKSANSSNGSNGSEINVIHSELIGTNNNAGETNAFATVVLEDSNITINVDDNSTIKANANQNYQFAFGFFGRKTPNNEFIEAVADCKVTVAINSAVTVSGDDGKYVYYSREQATLGNNVVKLPATYAEALQAEGWIVSEPTDGLVTISSAIAQVGDNMYKTLAEAVAAAKTGDTIKVLQNTTLSESLTLPAGIIFNGNGKQINGTIYAGGNLTFAGHTKVTSFSASYYDRVITIGEGACLEVTGTGRVTLGYRNTFNITGSIENAKTADKTNIQPTLIIPGGISITGGNGATMNVTDAYISLGNTSSKNSEANGKFTLNFTNSIIECKNQFTLSEPTNGNNPEFEVNITNSVMTTAAAKLCIAATNSTVVVDNSILDLKNNFRNSGTFTLKKGSKMTGATIQFGENGGNNGTINVDNSSFTIIAGSTGHAFDGKGIGSINATNGATVNVDYYQDMTITVDATSTFTGVDVYANKKIYYTGDMKVDPTNAKAFGDAVIVSNEFKNGKGVIKFDRDIKTIGNDAFKYTGINNWMTSITLPKSVTSIGDWAFYQNFSLETINIPDSVVSIGQYAFSSCNAVTSVTIGSGVTNIASGAFYFDQPGKCYINTIICKPTIPPTIADKWVFYNVKPERVVVPADSVEAYKAAWSMFADKIVAGEF